MFVSALSSLPTDFSSADAHLTSSIVDRPVIHGPAYYPTRMTMSLESVVGDTRIRELSKLPDDWDGYGAAAISHEISAKAREYLQVLLQSSPLPEIEPNANGTISFEWRSLKGAAHLEIGQSTVAFSAQPVAGAPVYAKGPSGPEEVAQLGAVIRRTVFTDNEDWRKTSSFL